MIDERNGIPKVIHYCWFGGTELPLEATKCIESWKRYCPDYEIIRWDESNYDIKKNKYMYDAYKHKKWAFVSDYARLDIVYQNGGIYLDTDVELVKSIDDLLSYEAFAGMEQAGVVAFGLGFGVCRGNNVIKEIMDVYESLEFIKEDGRLNLQASPQFQTMVLRKYGLREIDQNQLIKGIQVFATEYFCPIEFSTNIMRRTDKTYSIHHFTASWCTPKQARLRKVKLIMYEKNVPGSMQKLLVFPFKVSIVIDNVGFFKFMGLVKDRIYAHIVKAYHGERN